MVNEPAVAVPHLRLVAPLVDLPWLEDRFRLTSLEVWDTHVLVHYSRFTRPQDASDDDWMDGHLACTITDDLGTKYRWGRGSLGSCSSHGFLDHGSAEFAPAPPLGATIIRVLGPHDQELAAVDLI